MSQQPIPLVTLHKGQPTTTSLAVAAFFGKRHDNVLRAIQSLQQDCPGDFNLLNFEEIETHDRKGRLQPAYILTQSGFVLLAMGFTGIKAFKWKIAYIQAFDDMARYIRETKVPESEQYFQGYRDGVEHTAHHFLGEKRARLARNVFLHHVEGVSQSLIGRATGVSRHVVSRILKKLAFLRDVYRGGRISSIRRLLQSSEKAR